MSGAALPRVGWRAPMACALLLVAASARAAEAQPAPSLPGAATPPVFTPQTPGSTGPSSYSSSGAPSGGTPGTPAAPGGGPEPAAGSGAAAASTAPAASEDGLATRAVPTIDGAPAESDHDAVRGAWGVEVRPVETTLPAFALRPGTGCVTAAADATGACPDVRVSALGVRHWVGRNLAVDVGLALAAGGGRDNGRLLDTYFGLGPRLGGAVLLSNRRHVAVAAVPELSLVVFKGAGSLPAAYVVDLRAAFEAEVHFGFIGVPALSVGLRSGLLFRLERAADVTLWSIGVAGATSLRGLVTDLALRYYF